MPKYQQAPRRREFDYQRMGDNPNVDRADYSLTKGPGIYATVTAKRPEKSLADFDSFDTYQTYIDGLKNPYGLKFHISVDDTNDKNMTRAWNYTKDVLIEEGVTDFKVVRSKHRPMRKQNDEFDGVSHIKDLGRMHTIEEIDEMDDVEYDKHGKQITVYAFKDPSLDWARIMVRVNETLRERHVRPDGTPTSDRRLDTYVSYRDDSVGNHRQISPRYADLEQAYLQAREYYHAPPPPSVPHPDDIPPPPPLPVNDNTSEQSVQSQILEKQKKLKSTEATESTQDSSKDSSNDKSDPPPII